MFSPSYSGGFDAPHPTLFDTAAVTAFVTLLAVVFLVCCGVFHATFNEVGFLMLQLGPEATDW